MKRVKYVVEKSLKNPEIEYLWTELGSSWHKEDAFFKFMLKSSITDTNVIEGTPLYSQWNPMFDKVIDTTYSSWSHGSCHKFEYENVQGECPNDTITDEVYYMYQNGDDVILFKEIPLLMNDEMFTWKENTKYNATEAVVAMGAFEYHCIVSADGNGKVIVRYVKCENFHRTRVTIAEFDVKDAYNETFCEAIKKWNDGLKSSIAS